MRRVNIPEALPSRTATKQRPCPGEREDYEAQLHVMNDGGKVKPEDGKLIFNDCDSIVLVLAAETSYLMDHTKGWMGEHPHKQVASRMGEHPHKQVASRIDAVSAKDYGKLLKDHIADHQSLFNRLGLDVGKTDPAQAALPTDKRIKACGNGVNDPDLTEMLFQYGRYLLIACSRPGSLPANLQGVWNDSNRPAWHCDYHSNINVQMNYWLAEPSNLSECHLPLLYYFAAAAPLHRRSKRSTIFSAAVDGGGTRSAAHGSPSTSGNITRSQRTSSTSARPRIPT